MISNISFEANGTKHELRFSARAMMEIERATGEGVMEFIKSMEGGSKIETVLQLFQVCLNAGKGMPEEEALDIMDEIGTFKASELAFQAVSESLPKAETGDAEGPAGEAEASGKNEKGAG